ncbi:hypothetical protein ACIQM4_20745 [Streptomyces sp. NPDC091272]|uniref:hypothetical protein n=1 Tax=Streptomyces sp. NPDC091272 TaxID=3365981 RepID=UPI0038018896
MSTTSPSASGPQAPGVDQTNTAIRRLVDAQTTDAAWPSEEYELLLVEWAAAMRDEATEPVS